MSHDVSGGRMALLADAERAEASEHRRRLANGNGKRFPDHDNSASLLPTVTVRSVCLKDVQPRSVRWLWERWIPLGKLTLIEGDPGLGKSTLTIEIAARVSRGEAMPADALGVAGAALFVTYEDGVEDTIVPRLRAAGGDPARVHVVQGVRYEASPERLVRIPEDVEALRLKIQETEARVVIIDPLGAALSGEKDSYKDSDARSALAPLAMLAEELGVAVILVRHLNKRGASRAIAAGGGSIGFAGAARSVLAVYPHPENESHRVLAVVKSNLAPHPPAIAFSLEDDGLGWAYLHWRGQSAYSAEQLNARRSETEDASDPGTGPDAWLREVLAAGPLDRRDVLRLGASSGFKERALERSLVRIGGHTTLSGFGRDKRSEWSLGTNPVNPVNPAHVREGVGHDGYEGVGEAGSTAEPKLRLTAHGMKPFPRSEPSP